jgi:undecaprenyl diphosphate synthase
LFQINLFINYISKQFKNATITKLCNEIEPTKEITFNLKECVEFINPITDKQFKATLKTLGFKLLKSSAIVPGYRKDLVNQYDLCEEVIQKLSIDAIDEKTVDQYLWTNFMPDPDLLIRTGGEVRISNYLLWQIAYSELYFCDTYWPDFDEEELHKAIKSFQSRQRRYGKTEAQVEAEVKS